MNRTSHHLRDALVITAVLGLGLATLPAKAYNNHCKMMKPYGYMGHMHSHGPHQHYSPMKPYGHSPYGHSRKSYSYDNSGRYNYSQPERYSYSQPERYSYGQPERGADARPDQAQAPTPAPEKAATLSDVPAAATGPDIIETAAVAQNFKTLLRASEAAGLYDTLRGEGPFTVFAPNDEAFKKLPEGTLDALLADQDRLVAVLSYHVVSERLTAADLLQRREITTVQGQTLNIDQLDVAAADIEASNGIIHAIDSVLIPTP